MDSTHIKAGPHLCEHESSWRMLTFQTAPVFCFQSLDCSRSATVARNQKHNSIHELLGGLIYVIINSLGCVVSAHIWLGILWEINVQAMSSTVATALGTSKLIRKPNQLIHARIFTIISIYDISIMKIHHDQLVVFSIVIHDKVFYYPFYTQCPAHNTMWWVRRHR